MLKNDDDAWINKSHAPLYAMSFIPQNFNTLDSFIFDP